MQIGRDTISRVTDAILEDVQAWRTRPLERVYAIAYFDCLMVKVRDMDRSVRRPGSATWRIGVSVEGERECPRDLVGGARGREVLARCPERPAPARRPGRPGVLRRRAHRVPRARSRQSSREHGFRAASFTRSAQSMRYVAYTERKRVAGDLKPIYRAVNVEAAEAGLGSDPRREVGREVPHDRGVPASSVENITTRSSRSPPTYAEPSDTTNSIENLDRQIKKGNQDQRTLPRREQAATKLIYLAIRLSRGQMATSIQLDSSTTRPQDPHSEYSTTQLNQTQRSAATGRPAPARSRA